MNRVFLSYAREDERIAEKLYLHLRQEEINVWFDKKSLLPGQNWRKEISKVIRDSKFFISLISKNSVNKRGYVQKEIKYALRVLEEIPTNQIFLIPVRLDDTLPIDEELLDLTWIDLFDSFSRGFNRIMSVIANIEKEELEFRDPKKPYGKRDLIDYAPYIDFGELVREILNKFPVSAMFFNRDHSYYITFRTDFAGCQVPSKLLNKYPDLMTIVLQNGYEDLYLNENYISIGLSFEGVKETLKIDYDSIRHIYSPTINFSLKRLNLKD